MLQVCQFLDGVTDYSYRVKGRSESFQGSLALTCYNSTRVTESHKIEYKSHETSEQACADACTANDKVCSSKHMKDVSPEESL